jgi:hypothetical protein
MPKLSHSAAPKYRKHNASGQAIVTIQGKDHYLGPYGAAASKREHDRLVAEWTSLQNAHSKCQEKVRPVEEGQNPRRA